MRSWQEDVLLGAEQKGDSLLISISSKNPWTGKLYFDKQRHKENMNLPIDWPRINQFPEWFIILSTQEYKFVDLANQDIRTYQGAELLDGLELFIEGDKKFIVY